MLHTDGKGAILRTRLCSRSAAGRHSDGSIRWPILIPVGAVALTTVAPSAAYAQQCFGSINAATSMIGTVNTAFFPSGSAFLSPAPNNTPDQLGGGAWTRTVAGTVDTKANTNFSASFTITPPGGPSFPFPLGASCRATSKLDFVGFEAGHDIAVVNSGNSEWQFGALAGYVGAKAQVPTQSNPQNFDFEAPSGGLYAAFSKGRFSADVQARLYKIQLETFGQRLDAGGYSFAGNAAYRFDLPGNWTLEPSVGGIFSRTSVDHLFVADVVNSAGVPIAVFPTFGATPLGALSGTMQINDVESLLGRASVTLGSSLALAGGQIVAYPFLTASVFHEFEGNVTASITAAGTGLLGPGQINFQGRGNITASSVGTFGQFGVGSAFELADTGWLGYGRFDYRTGENVEAYIVSAGLRYQLDDPRPVTGNRARNPVKAVPAERYDWTGPYVGVFAGSTWGRMHWDTNVDPDHAGVLAGGQATR